MQTPDGGHPISRRGWFQLMAGALAAMPALAGKEFWETKDPDDWTADELKKLLTKSPWAHEIYGERTAMKKKDTDFPHQAGSTAKGRPRITNNSSHVAASFKGTVVWESAKPIRLASKEALGSEFADMYVLSLAGVPIGTSKAAMDRVRQATTLHLKGHDPLTAGTVRHLMQGHDVFLFGFSRQALAISREDKEVLFSTTVNRVSLTHKFNPREMLYRGELAL